MGAKAGVGPVAGQKRTGSATLGVAPLLDNSNISGWIAAWTSRINLSCQEVKMAR